MVTTTVPPTLWRHVDFVRLWTANTASAVGSRVCTVAIPLLAVNTLAATPWDMGALSSVQNVGVLLVGLPAGAWIDRIRRRRLMLGMDLVRAFALAALPIAALVGNLRLGLLFAVAFVTSVSGTFFDIAQQTYVPTLVGTDRVAEANARIQASQSVAVASGPGLGGGLVALVGAANTVVVTSVTFLMSFLALRRIEHEEERPVAESRNLVAEIGEGLRYVLGDAVLRAIAFCTATSNLFMSMTVSLLVVFLVRTIGLSPLQVGLVVAQSGIGGVLAALTVGRWIARFGANRVIWLSVLVTQPFALLLPLAEPGARVALFVVGWLVLGYGGTTYNIVQVSYRQASCPPRLLGRVQASNRFFAWGTLPLGGLLGGALGSALDVRAALAIAAIGGLGSVGWLLASPLPRMNGEAATPIPR